MKFISQKLIRAIGKTSHVEEFRLWTGALHIWADDGVYTLRAIELKDGKITWEENLSFISKQHYKLGHHSPESFAEDGLVKAVFGSKDAERLGQFANRFSEDPYIFGFDVIEGSEPIASISRIDAPFIGQGVILHANDYIDRPIYFI